MNDPELFELCKEVYKRTEWKDTDCVWYSNAGEVHDKRSVWHKNDVFDKPANVPLYSSDYLLEKLPANVASKIYEENFAQLWTRKDQDKDEPERYFAYYAVMSKENCMSDFGVHSDTPLKALLKIVIALHEAGDVS